MSDSPESLETLHWRVRSLEERPYVAPEAPYVSTFDELLRHEVSVNLGLLDMLQPGDTAFDVGTNIGRQAAIMSRVVSSTGHVVAIEANPATALLARDSFRILGCNNVDLINRAATEKTGDAISLFTGNGANDSIIQHAWLGADHIQVKTISLDDLAAFLGLTPKVIKIDIEGAEIFALRGAEKLISEARPVFILEQNAKGPDCVNFLRERGYECVCLNSYKRIERTEDYPRFETDPVRNIVCYPTEARPDNHGRNVYGEIQLVEVANIPGADFALKDGVWTSPDMSLAGGRYSIIFNYDCPEDTSLEIGIWNLATGKFEEFYAGGANWLQYACFDLPFHLDRDTDIQVRMGPADRNLDHPFRPLSAIVTRVEGIAAARPAMSFLF